MESTKHSLSITSQPQSTQFPYSSSSTTQLQGGYMGQQMGYSYYTQQHELFAQYNKLYPSSGILPASLFPDKREVILREIEKERIRARMMVIEIEKMRLLEGKIGKEEATVVGASESSRDDIFLKKIQSLGSSDTMLDKTELLENPKPGLCETNQSKRTQSVQKNPDLKKTMWCEMCQVGACSEITMNDHEKGKKHLKRLKRRAENGETVLGCQNEKMEVPLDCVQHVSEGGKNIIVENVTVCQKGGYNSVNESKVEENETALEVIEQNKVNAQHVDIVEPGSDSTVDAFLPEDDIIAKGELRQTERRSFLPDTFVLRENELLEHSKFDQFKAAEVRVSEMKCGIQNEQEEEEIVLMVNLDAKSKVVTPPVADSNIYPSGNSILYGKAEIIATTESALNKASLIQQSSGKKTTIGKIAADTVLLNQTELLEKLKPGNLKKDKERMNGSVQTNCDSKKTKFCFWCEMCQIGAPSEIVMNGHEKGKKHIKRLKRRAENGETVLGYLNEKMEVPLDCVQHVSEGGKNIIVENVTVLEKGGYNSVYDSKVEEYETASEVTEQDEINAQRVDIVEPGSDSTVSKGELRQTERRSFLSDTFVLKESELLEHSKFDQFKIAAVRVSEVKCGIQNEHEEEEIVLMVNPDAKSKVVTPPVADNNIYPSGNSILYGKAEIIATTEPALNKASLKQQSSGKNTTIGKIAADTVLLKQTELLEKQKPVKLKTDKERINKGVQTNGDLKKTKFSFWCEMCQVGACSEIIMNDHEKGKKHLKRLKRIAENGETVLVYQNEKMEVPLDCVQHVSEGGKNIIVENVTVCEKGGYNSANESKVEENEPALEVTEQDEINAQRGDIVEPGSDLTVDSFLPEDEIIAKGELRQTERRSFLPDTFVLREFESSEHSKFDQFKTAEVGVSEMKCGIQNEQEEEEIVLMVNPDGKSKVVTPPVADNNIYPSGNSILYGKAEIIGTTEPALNKASLKQQSSEKNTAIVKIAADTVLLKQTELLEKQKPGKLKKDKERINKIVQTNGDFKKSKFSFWCEMCQIGAPSEIVMNGHEKGKKHLRLLEDKARKDDTRVDKKENFEVPMNCVGHVSESGKGIPAFNVDVVLAEASSDLHIAFDSGFETSPLIRAADLKVLEIVLVTENCEEEEEEKVIYVGNPCATISGSKSKAVTPPVEDISKHQSDILSEKAKVIDVSESVSNGSLKSQYPGKGSSIENIAANTVLLEQTKVLECPKQDNLKRAEEKTNQSVQKNVDPKKTKYSFWCEMCQVGALSKTVMNAHEKGKKHLSRLLVRAQKSGTVNGPVNSVYHGSDSRKGIASCHVDAVLIEASSDLHKPLEASDTGHKNLPIQIRASDIFMANSDATISESKSTVVIPPVADTSKHPSDKIVYEKAEVTTNSESALNEACLKLQSPGKNSSIVQNASDTMLKGNELLDYSKPDNFTTGQETIQSVQRNSDVNKTTYSFWCEMCQVETLSEIDMNCHEKGRKHLRRLEERTKQGESRKSNQKVAIDVPANYIHCISDNGKSILSHGADLVSDEARLELRNPLDASPTGFETLPVQMTASTVSESKSKAVHGKINVIAVSESVSDGSSVKPQSPGKSSSTRKISDGTAFNKIELPESPKLPKLDNLKRAEEKTNQSVQKNVDPKKTKYSFWCEMCQVGALSETVMNAHEKGKKHLSRLLVRAQKSGTENDPVNSVYHGSDSRKGIASCHVDVVLIEARSDLHKPLEESDIGHKILRAADLRVSEAMPVTDIFNEEETIIFMANPDATISGSNSNTVTPPVVDISKHLSAKTLYKKAEVVAVSESVSNGSSLKLQSPGKNSNIEENAADTVLEQKKLLENSKSDNCKKDESNTNQKAHKNGDLKKTTYNFWCDLCQVGTFSEIVMYDHEKGNKHLRRLEERTQKGDTGEGSQKENIEMPVNSVEHAFESGKSILTCNVDVVLDEARLELRKPLNTSYNGFETSQVQIGLVDCGVQEVTPLTENGTEEEKYVFVDNPDATVFESKSKDVTLPVANVRKSPSDNIFLKKTEEEWSCAICLVNFISESALNEHLCRKEHKFGEGALKPQSLGDNVSSDTMLLENPKPGKYQTDEAKRFQSVTKNPDPKKTRYNFWCEMCQLGVSSEIILNDHKKGKKHLKRLEGRAENGKMEVPSYCVQHVSEAGKNIVVENVNGCEKGSYKSVNESKTEKNEMALEVTEQDEINAQRSVVVEQGSDSTADAFLPEDEIIAKRDLRETEMKSFLPDTLVLKKNERNEIMENGEAGTCDLKQDIDPVDLVKHTPEVGQFIFPHISSKEGAKAAGVVIIRARVSSTLRAVSPKDGKLNAISEWKCELCQVIATNKSSLNEHLCGKKHKLKEASLKTQGPTNNSSDKVVDEKKGRKRNEIIQIGEAGPCDLKQDIEPVNLVKHIPEVGKFIFPHISTKEDAKAAGVDIIRPGVSSTLLAVSPKDGKLNAISEWNCELCQVIATNKSSLNEHLCGKKHKLKEASLKTQRDRNNSSDKVADEEKGRKHNEIVQNGEAGPCDLKQDIEPVNLVKHFPEVGQFIFPHISTKEDAKAAGVDIIRPGVSSTLRAVSPNDGKLNGISEWKCELCQVIATNKSSLNEHLCGKKHKLKEASLKTQRHGNNSSDKVADEQKGRKHNEIVQNGEVGPCDLKQDIEPVNLAKHFPEVGQFIFPHISTKEDAKAAGVDIIRPGVSSTLRAVSPNDGKLNAISEWKCELCQVIATNKSSLNEHLCGKKHKLKEASLKTERSRNNSSDKVVDEEKGRKCTEIVQNGEAGPCNLKQDIEPVNLVNHFPEVGQLIFPHISTKEDARQQVSI